MCRAHFVHHCVSKNSINTDVYIATDFTSRKIQNLDRLENTYLVKYNMRQIFLLATLCVVTKLGLVQAEKEVLIRDRLVLVLCDQKDEYLQTGTFPEPVKTLPAKYKNFKPGNEAPSGGDGDYDSGPSGRSAGMKGNYKVVDSKNKKSGSSKNRYKRSFANEFAECHASGNCVLDLNEE